MAGIENLKKRILDDDINKAKTIEGEGKLKAAAIIEGANAKALKATDEMKEKAEKDGLEKKERLISRAHLDARNSLLVVKQNAIENVFEAVSKHVAEMDENKYKEFLTKLLINNIESGDEEILFSAKDKAKIGPEIIASVNNTLLAEGKKAELKISNEERNLSSGGFLIKKGGVEINCTIESQIRVLRDNLEGEIANLLFEGK